MTEHQVGELLLDLALLFALTYLLAGLLERVRIPGILLTEGYKWVRWRHMSSQSDQLTAEKTKSMGK